MKVTANYLIQLAGLIILIFGGTMIIVYSQTGDILIDQLIGTSIGVVLLIASLIWKKVKKSDT
ncbi:MULTISPECIES: hypothetical protein [Mesobacillus]|uniref:hypothetical protein n=1 Tax=Mesobacillus TaxID=2675231 RepID=UPI00177BAFDC|nr:MULTISPECIES: hypothetical protein [Mesobacillus]MCM3575316.1 hypothetical protein [Mesobacillus subterraneus]UYZ24047.1 hypothetical protein FOF60_11130 [Mesobacillus jeotgali]